MRDPLNRPLTIEEAANALGLTFTQSELGYASDDLRMSDWGEQLEFFRLPWKPC